MKNNNFDLYLCGMRAKLYEVVFGTQTRAGRNFDVILLILIVISVTVVMVESVPEWRQSHFDLLRTLEWSFTALFTAEYLLRIWISPNPWRYIKSYWGIIDLLAILPSYLVLIPWISMYGSFRAIRALRLMRIFRILRLSRFTSEYQALIHSLKASSYKITIFLFFVVLMMVIAGTLMYVIEGGKNGFDSIPAGIYWAIVTVTTVGFGDITPATEVGKFLASVMMITGYAIIAVPTGLISVEMSRYKDNPETEENLCDRCGHDNPLGSVYCNQCGSELTHG